MNKGKEKEKDPTKLKAEELEKRVAPLSLTYTDPTSDPTSSPTTSTTDTSGHKQGQTGGGGGGKLVQ